MNEPGGARSRRAHFPQLKRLGKLAAAGARLSSRSAAQSMGRFEDAQLARQRHACRRESSRSFAVSSRETATTAGRQAAFPTRLKNPRRGMWTRSGRFWTRASSGASRPAAGSCGVYGAVPRVAARSVSRLRAAVPPLTSPAAGSDPARRRHCRPVRCGISVPAHLTFRSQPRSTPTSPWWPEVIRSTLRPPTPPPRPRRIHASARSLH